MQLSFNNSGLPKMMSASLKYVCKTIRRARSCRTGLAVGATRYLGYIKLCACFLSWFLHTDGAAPATRTCHLVLLQTPLSIHTSWYLCISSESRATQLIYQCLNQDSGAVPIRSTSLHPYQNRVLQPILKA